MDEERGDFDSDDDDRVDDEIDISTDTTVTEAMSRLQWIRDVHVEPTRSDVEKKELVNSFLRDGCGCNLWKQKCCSLQFSVHCVEEVRSQCASLSHNELDLVLLGQLMAASNNTDTVVTESGHIQTPRQKTYTKYTHQGLNVCATMFRFSPRCRLQTTEELGQELQVERIDPTHPW